MTTDRLYWNDPLALRFEGRVVARTTWKDAPSLVLDRSAFYPESGGQMADRGTLAGLGVVDVQLDEEKRIHHVVKGGDLPEEGATVEGAVEPARRRLHMAQHTGQHMLSRALLEVADAPTVSSRLGESGLTIDVPNASVPEEALAEAERLVNRLVDEDRPVRAWFPDETELAGLDLRSKAEAVDGPVRVVQVEGFDAQPCGGTHCTRTAQVGMVRILGTEAHRGGTRIHFAAGRRAREGLLAEAAVLRALAAELTCGPAEVPTVFAKLRREATENAERAGQAVARLADELAGRLAGETSPVVTVLDGHSAEVARAVAARLCTEPGAAAVVAARSPEGTQVIACRGEKSDFHSGQYVRRLAEATGGRGGGRPERAEGRFPADVDEAALRAALEQPST